MKTRRLFLNRIMILLPGMFMAAACGPQAVSTPFRPPTMIPPTQPLPTTTPVSAIIFTPAEPTAALTSTPEGPCTNDLTFLSDATIPDGTSFTPGASIDKQWLVQNSGTCNWNGEYRLVYVGGDPLGAANEQAMFPAKAGAQATLQIQFIAPDAAGDYASTWRAQDADGNLFGDPVTIVIVVTP